MPPYRLIAFSKIEYDILSAVIDAKDELGFDFDEEGKEAVNKIRKKFGCPDNKL